jgi:peptidoglycan/LPS O-acetylase OafA/YrhL
LLAPLAREKSIKLGRFFARRVLRIMPAYFAILAIYFLLPSWREYPGMAQPLWKFLLSVQNIALHGGTAFSHAWSLAVEDQFYLCLPFILLVVNRWPRAAIIIPCVIVFGGIALRTFLAWKNPAIDGGVSFRAFQAWIYYPSWTRLDPLVFGVVLAAIERFRPHWWKRLMNLAIWLWLPALVLISYGLYLGEGDNSHSRRVRLAISAHRTRHGRASDLRSKSALDFSVNKNSRRSVHRQHRVQRVPDTETRHPRG